MAITRFESDDAVNERTDAEYATRFIEASGATIDDAAILTIVATLKNVKTDATINSRAVQNVKGANGGSLASDGTFTLALSGNADNVIVNPELLGSGKAEEHRLTLQVTYTKTGGGTGYLTHEVRFYVLSLEDVTN